MKKKAIFNFGGDDSLSKRKLVGGNPTNLIDITSVKYNWGKKLYRNMMENFWIPEKIDLTKDAVDYRYINRSTQSILDKIISSLTFLDSIQMTNLPNISDFITAPEVNLALSVHSFQEAVHSQSYSYLVNSIIPKEKLENYFDTWKNNNVLYERNEFLVYHFQLFSDNPSIENFLRACIATYVLESISFYMGFNFFYYITYKENLLFGVTDLIRYINRDEFTHIVLFQNIIKTLKLEEEGISKSSFEKIVEEIFTFGVDNEKKWMREVLANANNFDITKEVSDEYINYIANLRLKDLGCRPLFDSSNVNPLSYLESISGLSQTTLVKSNFFEQHVTSYNMSSSIDWSDF